MSRTLAAELIRHHEQGRYDDDCSVGFLKSSTIKESPGINSGAASFLDLRAKLGQSLCTYSVVVTGISLTSETTRDVVFAKTRTYDAAKLVVLSGYVDALFARLYTLPVQALRSEWSTGWDPTYDVVVIDPSDGRKCLLGHGLTHLYEKEAKELARTRKLTIDDVWGGAVPSGLTRHRQQSPTSTVAVEAPRVARLQLFDDGWRVLDISPPFAGTR